MQHVARGAAAAHLRDLLAGLHALALVDQACAIVAIRREPLLVVLDDHQLAVTHQARPRIHHHAIGRSAHRLAALACDVDALARGIAAGKGLHDPAIGRPAPADGAGRGRNHRCRYWLRGPRCRRALLARRRRGIANHAALRAWIQAQALAGMDGVRRGDVVPQGQVERGQAVFRGNPVDALAALDHRDGTEFRLGNPHRALSSGHPVAPGLLRFAHHVAAPATGEQDEQDEGGEDAMRVHASHHAACPRNSNQPITPASKASTAQPTGSM